ncbi:MAG: hypothetical protein JXB26_17725 [Candidatus Aminicenantes bacterium]|nr:hypothetical protein [Candidatus Aminicenantes bacterium]
MIEYGHTLEMLIGGAVHLKQVRKSELHFGDMVFIITQNSVYTVHVLGDEQYLVSGGWFDRKKVAPKQTSITGCTWGGNIIKMDILAACGMRVEFGNRVVTTPIQHIIVTRLNSRN